MQRKRMVTILSWLFCTTFSSASIARQSTTARIDIRPEEKSLALSPAHGRSGWPARASTLEQAFALACVGRHQRGAFELGAGFVEAAQFFEQLGARAGQ